MQEALGQAHISFLHFLSGRTSLNKLQRELVWAPCAGDLSMIKRRQCWGSRCFLPFHDEKQKLFTGNLVLSKCRILRRERKPRLFCAFIEAWAARSAKRFSTEIASESKITCKYPGYGSAWVTYSVQGQPIHVDCFSDWQIKALSNMSSLED